MYKIRTEYYYRAKETDKALKKYKRLIDAGAIAQMYASGNGVKIVEEDILDETESEEYKPIMDEWSGD